MTLGNLLDRVVEVLLSGQTTWILAVATVVTISSPFVDRYVVRRKRLHYRVQYNSKIGLSPVNLRKDEDQVTHVDSQLSPVIELLDRMSIVVIRIRNTGVEDIADGDFTDPLEFSFGRRVVWNARISEPSVESHRRRLKEGLEFFTHDDPGPSTEDLADVRKSLGERLGALLRSLATARPEPARAVAQAPRWHGVRLRNLALQRREQFKLVVVLREPDDAHEPVVTKDISCSGGHLSGGRVVDERKQRRLTWPRAAVAVGLLLTGVLLATVLVALSRPQRVAEGVACGAGSLTVVGSSAFTPVIGDLAEPYEQACGDVITVESTGSIGGVRRLAGAGADEWGGLAALSDGEPAIDAPGLVAQPVAVIVYAVVVGDGVGVDSLTRDELRGIYLGEYTDWNQLRDGPSLPIRIVGRGQESGSRLTFEARVLGGSEGELTSNSCERPDRSPSADVIRCERGSETEVIEEVSTTPGAIGYVDLPSAVEARTDGVALTMVRLDEHYPSTDTAKHGYPFWTVEYLYTRGEREEGSTLASFVEYLRSGTARARLAEAGYPPCVDDGDTGLHRLCR